MNWTWEFIGLLLFISVYLGAVPVIIVWAIQKLFPVKPDQVRGSRMACYVVAIALPLPIFFLLIDLDRGGPIDWAVALGFPAIFLIPSIYYLFYPGIDILPEGLSIRRLSGRQIKIPWCDVERAKLTTFRQYFTVVTTSGRRFGLHIDSFQLGRLYEVLAERNIPVPERSKFRSAVRGSL